MTYLVVMSSSEKGFTLSMVESLLLLSLIATRNMAIRVILRHIKYHGYSLWTNHLNVGKIHRLTGAPQNTDAKDTIALEEHLDTTTILK